VSRTLLVTLGVIVVVLQPGNPGHAQESPLFPILVDGKLGYIEASGKVVIPPRFAPGPDNEVLFNEGLAVAREPDGRKGFIDRTGRFVIAPQFPEAGRFSEGLAFAHLLTARGTADGSGFIDVSGARVIHFPYASPDKGRVDAAKHFAGGLAPVAWSIDTITKAGPNTTRIETTTKWGYVDKTGKVVIPYQFADAEVFSEGLAAVQLGPSAATGAGLCGYIDPAGQVVIGGAYHRCSPFGEGLAVVMRFDDKPDASPPSRHGYVDKTGKLVVPLQYAMATPFVDGFACVMTQEAAAFIDTTGKTVIQGGYRRCGKFSGGLAPVATGSGKWGFVDRTGRLAIPATLDETRPFENGLALALEGNMLKYIDRSGKPVWTGPLPK
jgi:hypothetical protein